MFTYVLTFMGGAAVGVIMDKIMLKVKSDKSLERSKVLEDCFGEPMCTNIFTISEAKEWIMGRKEQLENGAKAVIMKANDSTLKRLGKELHIGSGVENMMIVAVVDTKQSKMLDAVLIKYEALDAGLENALAKGNGVLVEER